ncbi:uncharacterized protein N7484_002698 [Penicillium longicatenatum]|uniref:uncharacterized protein n=1 Tax=Penicillium longicatenatum TaxID=1561947 RepID=UPI00254781E8|nr:uncharacterized protein N7484_002698 [Penicillium longicatenatum]KAJ5648975.1 hypothetical protein N7484_002698 [Penicillium longicatenatum]
MFVYLGKITYEPYAKDELIAVILRDNLQPGDKVIVLHQWTKPDGGKPKANSASHGTIGRITVTGTAQKEIEFLANEKDETYYWFKGTMACDKMNLSMMNKAGEEVAKNIELDVAFF